GESVKEFTVDAFNKLNSSGQNPIERISVQGKDDENGDVFLNTDFIEKRNTIDVEFDTATGEISSRDMLRKLMALSKLK
ncbi:MAG: hypothetical protein ABIP51_08985, partial [Bacteroidia bacterium]